MIQITKDDFEQALPVGVSAHDTVYESISPAIDIMLDNYCSMLLGEAGIKRVNSDDGSSLKQYFKMTVCIDAFLSVFRQLDLVLTPTGFGIVSNDTISPASKQRVDALEGQLRTALCRARAMTVKLLCSAEWGRGPEAKNFIRYLYTEHNFFFSGQGSSAKTYLDWQAFQNAIIDTDVQLRLRFGDELIDDFLDALRCNDHDRLTVYASAMQLACDVTDKWATMGKAAAVTPMFRRLERLVENDAETYALYRSSPAYEIAHIEHFSNKKESSGYVFNG